MATKKRDADFDSLKRYLDLGSDIAGGVSATAAGLLVGGPAGALSAAIGRPLLVRLFRSGAVTAATQFLDERSQARSAATLLLAASKIEDMLSFGHELRHDDFFQGSPSKRSLGEELVEGTLTVASKQYEERKVPFIANLLANMAFDGTIDAAHGHMLLRIAESLSFRQLCIISLVCGYHPQFRWGFFHDQGLVAQSLASITFEIKELERSGFAEISKIDRWGQVIHLPHLATADLTAKEGSNSEADDAVLVTPTHLALHVYELMDLQEIDAATRTSVGLLTYHLSEGGMLVDQNPPNP